MPLGRSRRKPGKPSFNGSPKDGLYDQLLHSLTGAKGLASEGEVRAYYGSNGQANWSLCEVDPHAPWPIQRRQAYTAVTLFTFEEYWKCIQGWWECECIDAYGSGVGFNTLPVSSSPSREDVLGEWLIRREKMAAIYSLTLPP